MSAYSAPTNGRVLCMLYVVLTLVAIAYCRSCRLSPWLWLRLLPIAVAVVVVVAVAVAEASMLVLVLV